MLFFSKQELRTFTPAEDVHNNLIDLRKMVNGSFLNGSSQSRKGIFL